MGASFISVDAARVLFPAVDGKRPTTITIRTWMRTGATAPDGEVVRLQGRRLGKRYMTTAKAVQQFVERMNEPAEEPCEA